MKKGPLHKCCVSVKSLGIIVNLAAQVAGCERVILILGGLK